MMKRERNFVPHAFGGEGGSQVKSDPRTRGSPLFFINHGLDYDHADPHPQPQPRLPGRRPPQTNGFLPNYYAISH